jgi:hypothetical protein
MNNSLMMDTSRNKMIKLTMRSLYGVVRIKNNSYFTFSDDT